MTGWLFVLLVVIYISVIVQIDRPGSAASKWWRRINSDQGYERVHSGLLAALGLMFVIFAGFFALGAMWTK